MKGTGACSAASSAHHLRGPSVATEVFQRTHAARTRLDGHCPAQLARALLYLSAVGLQPCACIDVLLCAVVA